MCFMEDGPARQSTVQKGRTYGMYGIYVYNYSLFLCLLPHLFISSYKNPAYAKNGCLHFDDANIQYLDFWKI